MNTAPHCASVVLSLSALFLAALCLLSLNMYYARLWKSIKRVSALILASFTLFTFLLVFLVEFNSIHTPASFVLGLRALQKSVTETIALFGGQSWELVCQARRLPTPLCAILSIGVYLMGILLPILTASTLLLLLGSLWESIALNRFGTQNYYVFSEISVEHVHFASSIYKSAAEKSGSGLSGKRSRIVFLRANLSREDLDPDLFQNLRHSSFALFPGNESDFLSRLNGFSKAENADFYFLSSDDNKNFDRANQLIDFVSDAARQHHKKKLKLELYVKSESAAADIQIDNLRQKCFSMEAVKDIHLLDAYRSLSYTVLAQHPLYESSNPTTGILILGLGHFGQQFLRTVLPLSEMAGRSAQLTLWDLNARAILDRMKSFYPEMLDGLTPSVKTGDVRGESFLKELENALPALTYIMISLGDDETNLQTALRIRRHYRILQWKNQWNGAPPTICVRIRSKVRTDTLEEIAKGLGLCLFGSDESIYSQEVLTPRSVWTTAEKLHKELTDSDKSWKEVSEYGRRSSIACACHLPYHIAAVLHENDLSEFTDVDAYNKEAAQRLDELASSEHDRWVRYVRCEGMTRADIRMVARYLKETRKHVDVFGKVTPCVCAACELDSIYRKVCYLYKKNGIQALPREFRSNDVTVVKKSGELYKEMLKSSRAPAGQDS